MPKLDLGAVQFELREDIQPGPFVDVIAEGFVHDGIVRFALGQIVQVGGEQQVAVAARLRMNMSTASDLARMLTDIVNKHVGPRGKAS